MEYQALYRSFRPHSFGDMVGQENVTQTLRRQVMTGHIAHAYLFSGTRGTGKTTASRVFARAVNCLSPRDGEACGECEMCRAIAENDVDLVEIDAASNNSVDDIRDLLERAQYAPAVARYKVYTIDEVHMLSGGAFNALLKTLEEPPKHVIFILATTEPQKLPATILSRCQRYDFRRFRAHEITARLTTVLSSIGREAEEGALLEIARVSGGTMRDALNLLDVCLAYADGTVTTADAREVLGTTGRALIGGFAAALVAFDAATALRTIDKMMRAGGDPELFTRDAADRLRAMMMSRVMDKSLAEVLEVTQDEAQEITELAKDVPEGQLIRQAELMVRAEQDMKRSNDPRCVLELATVRACRPEDEKDAGIGERLHRIEEQLANGTFSAASRRAPAVTAGQAPAAPAPRAQKAPEGPKAEPPAEYLAGVETLKQDPAIARAMDEMAFADLSDDTLTVSFTSRALMLQKMIEQRKMPEMEEAFTASFGRPIRVRFASAGGKKQPEVSKDVRATIARAYEVFDREKIEITDR